MTKTIWTIVIATTVFLTSCKETIKQDSVETTMDSQMERVNEDIVINSTTDKDGNVLEVSYNNTKGTAMVNYNGETRELADQRPASGIWYQNDQYELRGKGNDIVLKKDGNIVFEHEDEIVTSSLKNKDGHTLDMTFNNTTNEVKIYLNGGDQIELVGQKPGSGIWYKNDHYELRGKGENIELTKDGVIVFKK